MSADNGIYVARFPDGYRIAYVTAIDNLVEVNDDKVDLTDAFIAAFFGASVIFSSRDEALVAAIKMHQDLERKGIWTEYGICHLEFNSPITMSHSEAKAILSNHFKN